MKDLSEPAFPRPDVTWDNGEGGLTGKQGHPGMTLLQYYAGLAMQEILRSHLSHSDEPDFQSVALYSLKQAEAMIAEIERRDGENNG